MKKQLIKFVALAALCCVMFSCQKETTVYGTVFSERTGDPVGNLQVILLKNNKDISPIIASYGKTVTSTITGSDGQYEIVFSYDYENPRYWIYLSRDGGSIDYYSSDFHEVEINRGKANRFDLFW